MTDPTLDIASHLADLAVLATASVETSGISAKDSAVSIENLCKNLLDEEVSGAASVLFDKDKGLTAVMWSSIQRRERTHGTLVELRSEILRLIEWIFDDFTGRDTLHQLSEYVVAIVKICVRIFKREDSSKVRDLTFSPLLAALELRDLVPDPLELRAFLFPPAEEHDPTHNPSPIQQYWGHLSKQVSATGQTASLRGQSMRLLGRIALCFPVDVSEEAIYTKYRDVALPPTQPRTRVWSWQAWRPALT